MERIFIMQGHSLIQFYVIFSDICDLSSCYECSFKKRYHVSYMTIWACFSVYYFDKKMDDDKGTTRVLCHTKKTALIMNELDGMARFGEVEANKLISGVKEMFESIPINSRGESFFHDAVELDGASLFDKYYPITTKVKIKTAIRKILLITGTYRAAKKCLNKLRWR